MREDAAPPTLAKDSPRLFERVMFVSRQLREILVNVCGRGLLLTFAVAFLRFVGAHGLATFVQYQLVVAHKDAVLRLALEILYTLHGAVILARRRVQLNTNPSASLEVCVADVADDAARVVGTY